MPTVINNPETSGGDSGLGVIIGVIIAIILIALFFVYGLPAIRGTNPPADDNNGTNINVEIPNPINPTTPTPNPGTPTPTPAPTPNQ